MKVLVLGSTGMAGHTITLYFQEKGYEVTGYSMTSCSWCKKNIVGNAFEKEKFQKILLEGKYDVVINCIGLLNEVANSNPSKAVYLNSYLPHLIKDTLIDTTTRLIHMSTDCVFEGNAGPYNENSFRNGISFYDRSKALGEVDDSKNLTFRNSIIGPDINQSGIGLFNWFMKQTTKIDGYTGAIWTGVTTLTLAKAMEAALQENLTGLYNLVNNQSISKHDLICLFNKYFRDNHLIIDKSDNLKIDKSLRNTRTDFTFIVPSYEQMILEMRDWVYTHKDFYPHYFNQ